MNLDTPITEIKGVGKTTATRFQKLGIKKARDALFYFPFRYDDFSSTTPISQLQPEQQVNVIGYLELIQNKKSKAKKMNITEALVRDDSGEVKVTWFNQPFITGNLKVGDKVSLSGKVKQNLGDLVLNSPIYEKITSTSGIIHTHGIIPHYHSTEKLTQKQIRFLIKQVLPLASEIPDWMPDDIKTRLNLIDLPSALKEIHFPTSHHELEKAKYRLAFDELFLLQLQAQLLRQELRSNRAPKMDFLQEKTQEFVKNLPFELTYAQKRSGWEIIQDLTRETPMSRLLEGDVGSGKTLVAALAMLNVALNKGFNQSVLMVPTEILAEQHFNSLTQLFSETGIKIGILTKDKIKTEPELDNWNKLKKKDRVSHVTSDCHIIIGTHSLIQSEVEFKNLVLAIIDEQHRFGVEQRKTLIEKSGDKHTTPHLLSMTATPIPRTLALSLFGDLDISIIDQLPAQRRPIQTRLVPEEKRNSAYDFIKKQLDEGRQAFVVCPLIDPSDKSGVKSSKEEYEKLQNSVFPNKKIGMLHGKMKPSEKEEVMRQFLNKEFDVLVSTSVVEVGVDVPNATLMVIEGADRFGLAQLHQFRGRVGRGAHQSYCLLFTDSQSEKTLERLQTMEQYTDGFTLAKMDLKFRGSGEIYGTAQKGFPELKMATLWDHQIMKQAQQEAIDLVQKDPELKSHPLLKKRMDKYRKEVHLE